MMGKNQALMNNAAPASNQPKLPVIRYSKSKAISEKQPIPTTIPTPIVHIETSPLRQRKPFRFRSTDNELPQVE
jgi:hypothetical protein